MSDSYKVLFLWRNGEILTDTAFYAYLLFNVANDALLPISELHWHPSHKSIHCKLPCKTDRDYTNRLLVQAPEFNLSGPPLLDPRIVKDRFELITTFCRVCGIDIGSQEYSTQTT